MKHIFLIITLALLTISCNDDASKRMKQFNNLKQQAMDSHDVIMPKMDQLMQLSSQLTAIKDSTNHDVIMSKKTELQKASDDMMTWMRDYSEKFPYKFELPNDKDAAVEKLALMQEEFEKIDELKVRTLRVIEEAQQMLQQ